MVASGCECIVDVNEVFLNSLHKLQFQHLVITNHKQNYRGQKIRSVTQKLTGFSVNSLNKKQSGNLNSLVLYINASFNAREGTIFEIHIG